LLSTSVTLNKQVMYYTHSLTTCRFYKHSFGFDDI